MKTISILNLKGGVAKTFTAANMAYEIYRRGYRVLLIDADIIYMLEDYTGLTEGYCILGIRVTDYTGKVSETDTESGAVNV